MTTMFVVLFGLLIILCVNSAKATETSEETEDNADIIKKDDDDNISASLQFTRMDLIENKGDTIIKHDNPHNGDNYSQERKDTNSTDDSTTVENPSDSDEIIFNPDDNVKEPLIPSDTIRESNAQIEVIIEHITKAQDQNENNEKDVIAVSEEDNSNWRSAENFHSGAREDSVERVNDGNSSGEDDGDYSLEEYRDKKLSLNVMDRVEQRNPERREHQHIAKRPHHIRSYGPPDDHSIMESGPLRSFSEIILPRLRPTFTRNGFMYSPTLFPFQQSGSPFLDRLSAHNWHQSRLQVNPEREFFTKPRHDRVISLPQYEDSKMIDDYNDYGAANAYSYAPGKKATTPAPPWQIAAPPRQIVAPPRQIAVPNKFDIFKKLAEASSNSKSAQRNNNDNMYSGNFYPQRQYPESYGPFDVRRFRRHALDNEPYQDI